MEFPSAVMLDKMPIKTKMKCLLVLDGCHLVPIPFLPHWVLKEQQRQSRVRLV